MATKRAQRIGIWIIAGVLTIGTLGGFLATILSTKNQSSSQADYAQYLKDQAAYQTKVTAQAKQLSSTYYPLFSPYASRPAAYDLSSVTSLTTEDLVVGTGDAINDNSNYAAYYIGWNPKGKVFDQSIDGTSLKAPLDPSQGVITGWSEGVKGMHVGGIREVTIPSDKAYGEQAVSNDIPANTPLKFIIMAIPKPAAIMQPTVPASLLGGS